MIIPKKLILCFLLALALFVTGVMIAEVAFAADWFNEDWHYRRQITIDHTRVEDVADPSSTYADFPVLVYATGLSNINANGTDIRFTASDGVSELPRQIESYSGGTLYAWVKVTLTVDSGDCSSEDDVIYMYYGNPGATEPPPSSTYGSENVWDSNFVMIQHLQETSGTHFDSTAYGNDGTPLGGVTQDATGKIAGADQFDGTDDYVSITNNSGLQMGTGNWSASAWVYTNAFKSYSAPVVFDEDGPVFLGGGGVHRLCLMQDAAVDECNLSRSPGEWDNKWTHVAATRSGTTYNIYIDGVESSSSYSEPNWGVGANNYQIGKGDPGATAQPFVNGIIDEVRISNVVRSADWIKTSYNNQNAPSSFLTISEQVSIPTMTEWGMIIFMVLAGIGAIYYLRRKRIES